MKEIVIASLLLVGMLEGAAPSKKNGELVPPKKKNELAPPQCATLSAVPAPRFSPQLSFLYWGCAEKGLDYAVSSSGSLPTEMRVEQFHFEWNPAFRLFLGFGLPRDEWELGVSYSFFFKNTTGRLYEQALSVWTSPVAFSGNNLSMLWQYTKAKWKIFSNFFDLFLSEKFCNSTALSLETSFGLRGAFFNQDYDLFYKNETQSSQVKMKNNSFHVGPGFALATTWAFTSSWSLLGSLTGAVLASHFDVSRHEVDLAPVRETYRLKDEFVTCRPQGGGRLGFLWKSCGRGVSYEMAASYEAQIWWKQNMFLRHIDSLQAQVAPVQGDLFFQGLTLDLRVNY